MFPSNFVVKNVILSVDGQRLNFKGKTLEEAEIYIKDLEKKGYERRHIDVSVGGIFN